MEENESLLGDILSTYKEMMDAAQDAQELSRQSSNAFQRQKYAEARLGAMMAAATDDDRNSIIGYPLSSWSIQPQEH
ncbi:hypothetical protein R84981_002804 [Carnimonas sp. R-84981]|uniref:hypothetical protein n=1 Tax=Carnimonas bestiolae TaxID=3402172 RepID=UPI003EDBD3B8